MLVQVNRINEFNGSTVSEVIIDGKSVCYGLEDGHNETKIPGETRIPAGEYDLKLRTFGGYHKRFQDRYGDWHKGMIEICNVPGFTDILIHTGNTKLHTKGCLLVGSDYQKSDSGYFITSSRKAYKNIYPIIADKLAAGEDVRIVISDPE